MDRGAVLVSRRDPHLGISLAARVAIGWGPGVLLVLTGYHFGEPVAGWAGALAWSAHVESIGEALDKVRAERGLLPLVDELRERVGATKGDAS